MEMIVARMKADLKAMEPFFLGILYIKVQRKVDALHNSPELRKKEGPEFHAIAVLHLGMIEQEIAARGVETISVEFATPTRNRFDVHAMSPSRN